MLITPSFKKSLIVEQFQGNYPKRLNRRCAWYILRWKLPYQRRQRKQALFCRVVLSIRRLVPSRQLIFSLPSCPVNLSSRTVLLTRCLVPSRELVFSLRRGVLSTCRLAPSCRTVNSSSPPGSSCKSRLRKKQWLPPIPADLEEQEFLKACWWSRKTTDYLTVLCRVTEISGLSVYTQDVRFDRLLNVIQKLIKKFQLTIVLTVPGSRSAGRSKKRAGNKRDLWRAWSRR